MLQLQQKIPRFQLHHHCSLSVLCICNNTRAMYMYSVGSDQFDYAVFFIPLYCTHFSHLKRNPPHPPKFPSQSDQTLNSAAGQKSKFQS